MNSIDLQGIDVGRVDLGQFKKVTSNAIGGISSDIIAAFADLGYAVTGNDVKSMIINFQLDYGVIQSKNDEWAGNYGPRTRAALAVAHTKFQTIQYEESTAIEAARKQMLDEHTAWEQRYSVAVSYVAMIGSPRVGDRGMNISTLQSLLRDIGFFRGKNNGIMNTPTLIALKRYQKSRGIPQTGKLDSLTKSALADDAIKA